MATFVTLASIQPALRRLARAEPAPRNPPRRRSANRIAKGPSPGRSATTRMRRNPSLPRRPSNRAVRPTEAVFSGLQGRSSPLVPTVALCKNSAGVGMAASPSPKLSQNVEKPINSGARVGRRCRGRAVFARGDGLVQQCSDFLASDAARSTGPAPSVAHFRRRCSKEFPFQGVKQHR